MPKVKLDNTFALTARCENGRRKTDYWDKITSGFLLEVRASGGKTYAFRYVDRGGKQRQIKIGSPADISFDQARKRAQKLRSEVTLGGDPAADKQVLKSVPTYAALAADHLTHAKTYQRSFDTTEMYMRRHILPRWGKKRLDEIHQRDVEV